MPAFRALRKREKSSSERWLQSSNWETQGSEPGTASPPLTAWCRSGLRRWNVWRHRSRGLQGRWRKTPGGCQGDQEPWGPPRLLPSQSPPSYRWWSIKNLPKPWKQNVLRDTNRVVVLQRGLQGLQLSGEGLMALSHQDDAIKTRESTQLPSSPAIKSNKSWKLTHFWFLRSLVHSVGWTLDRDINWSVTTLSNRDAIRLFRQILQG